MNKKLKIRKALKQLLFKTFVECNATAEEDKLRSDYETFKRRKINAVKTIEDEIIEILNDEKLIEYITMESNEFGIFWDEFENFGNLRTLQKLVRTHLTDVKNTRRKENVSMRLPKLEIPRFCGDAKKCQIKFTRR